MTLLADAPTTAPAAPASPLPVAVRPAGRARVPAWWRDAVGVATWASMLVVVALWVAGGGVQALARGQTLDLLRHNAALEATLDI